MHAIGTSLLYLAFLATFATGLTAILGARLRSPGLLGAARHGLIASWLLFLALGACLVYGLVTHDFANKYIAAYTDRDMPLAYLLAGLWGGEKGALLFWTATLSTFACCAVLRNRTQSQVFMGYVTGFLALATFFFALLMVFEANPFEVFRAGAGPDDGQGMNPLLQTPLMAIQPPSLLTGYIAFTVPFAFGLAALVTGRLDSQWLRDIRTWTLASWWFLTVSLVLASAWVYFGLGWGRFWLWDPVENAAIITWFTATAFLHSAVIQERRNLLKPWSAVLVCLTFLLTMFGTFLTHSRLIDSVHAFTDSTLTSYFLVYMLVIAVISVVAIGVRWRQLRAVSELDSLFSREGSFLLGVVLLAGCAFIVLWGTLFGPISQARTFQAIYNAIADTAGHLGIPMAHLTQRVQLGEAWFVRVLTPLGLALLLVTALGPLLPWRRATRKDFQRNVQRPLTGSALLTLALALAWAGVQVWRRVHWQHLPAGVAARDLALGLGGRQFYSLVCTWFSDFIAWTIAREFHVGARARQRSLGRGYGVSLVLLTLGNQRRYGGAIVHLGVAMCFLAFIGNAFRSDPPELALHPGDATEVDVYTLYFTGQIERYDPDGAYAASTATVVAMERQEVVPASKVADVQVLLKTAGCSATAATTPGLPRVALQFADAMAGRRFAARQFAAELAPQVEIAGLDAQDPKLLHLRLSRAMSGVAGIMPPVVAKLMADLREYGQQRAPTPIELHTFQGQSDFDLAFASEEERKQFVADMRAGPWPGLIFARAASGAGQGRGVRVDVVPVAVGTLLHPEVRFYQKHSSPTTEVDIRSTFLHDLYLAMPPAQGQRATRLLAVVFPFMSSLWLGALTMLVGAAIAAFPSRLSASAAELDDPEPVARRAA